MAMKSSDSGSINRDPNLPFATRGALNADELYVVKGDLLANVYRTILASRYSTMQILARLSPSQTDEFEQYMNLARDYNLMLNRILEAMPMAAILLAQQNAEKEQKEDEKNNKHGKSLKNILDKFRMSDGGNRDELRPPTPPPEK